MISTGPFIQLLTRRAAAGLLAMGALAIPLAAVPASAQNLTRPAHDASAYPDFPATGGPRAGFRHHFWRGVPNRGLAGGFVDEVMPDAQ